MLAAGRSVSDMVEFSVERFGDRVIPELQAFFRQVQRGEVKVQGLTRGAREALFGMRLTPEEREALIRQAAYHKAESRGFVGGSPEQDWAEAEREVDALLAREIGIVPRGREALAELGETVERELGDLGRVVSDWLEGRSGGTPDAQAGPGTARETPSAAQAASTPAQPSAAAKPAKKKVAKKKAAKKKVAKKKAAKKDAAGTKSGKGATPAGKGAGKGKKK
jgi:hypothetical protein